MQRVKRNKIIAYCVIVLLLFVFTVIILSPATAKAFIKSEGGKESDFYADYVSHSTQIKNKVEEYCEYRLYAYTSNGTNVEHIFARSWAKDLERQSICNDYYNLRISDKNVNEIRGNKGFKTLPHNSETKVVINGILCGWADKNYFEPLDENKGDIARTLLYIYYNYGLKESEIENYFSVKEMKKWAKTDKLSNQEKEFEKQVEKAEGYKNLFLKRQVLVKFV